MTALSGLLVALGICLLAFAALLAVPPWITFTVVVTVAVFNVVFVARIVRMEFARGRA